MITRLKASELTHELQAMGYGASYDHIRAVLYDGRLLRPDLAPGVAAITRDKRLALRLVGLPDDFVEEILSDDGHRA